jgi:hypothetical protein
LNWCEAGSKGFALFPEPAFVVDQVDRSEWGTGRFHLAGVTTGFRKMAPPACTIGENSRPPGLAFALPPPFLCQPSASVLAAERFIAMVLHISAEK